ncbi:unnamed protein product [Spirodela intermedia]|uniref:Uncharacterized protein n=1 Tax=Spirodela intermedia TaxID=51605 RepID=A0A7I8JZG5_SPIIN|nr:unnamed protein product [Spirodela intermedia]
MLNDRWSVELRKSPTRRAKPPPILSNFISSLSHLSPFLFRSQEKTVRQGENVGLGKPSDNFRNDRSQLEGKVSSRPSGLGEPSLVCDYTVGFVSAQALLLTGSARWSARFSRGPFPVTMACTKKPNMENMASLPFLISFTFSSAKASGSSRVGDLPQRPAGNADALSMHQARVSQVVEPALAEDLRAGLEPDGLSELDAVASEQLREDAAEGAEHGPAGVDDLQLPEGASPEKGPRYLTRSGPYQGLPEEMGFGLAAVFLMVILPSPRTSEVAGASFTACPAKEGEERAMVAAICTGEGG